MTHIIYNSNIEKYIFGRKIEQYKDIASEGGARAGNFTEGVVGLRKQKLRNLHLKFI